jgi:hypothetical protein
MFSQAFVDKFDPEFVSSVYFDLFVNLFFQTLMNCCFGQKCLHFLSY